jgi:N-acetyl-gamma-glutamyl-phosphate reductase
MTKIFVDGSAGTTGLQIHERLSARRDLTVLTIDEAKRKDPAERARLMNAADVVFLCLPDAAAIEAVGLVENPNTCIIDTSTAHRVADGWVYGFPEIGYRAAIAESKRIANPGCHATGFISIVYPLIASDVIPADALLSCFSLTGYSGGGKKMIAEYEDAQRPVQLDAPGIYGVSQMHKHLPEMQKICRLAHAPLFSPIVADYYKGMAATVPLHLSQYKGAPTLTRLRRLYADFYAGQPLISVRMDEMDKAEKIYGNAKADTDGLQLIIAGNDERATITALFDNLGKGASGAAIENMNIVLGLEPTLGLKA